MDTEEMFGIRDSASRRGSVASDSDIGSVRDDDDDDDDGGRNNPMDEALEVPDPEAEGQQAEAAVVVKPKRVVKNPMPKLDLIRVAGPRGIPALPKYFKNVKFQGKGHEKEDLDMLLKHLEHWAHRLYPRFPFKNVLEDLEKLGNKKPVKVMMKRYRLDMFEENEVNRGADDVIMGEEENVNPEPVVDVFDELLGPAFPSTSQPVEVPQKPISVTLTAEQRERVERNKRLAEERRLARMKEQQNSEVDISLETQDDLNHTNRSDGAGARTDQVEDLYTAMETGNSTGKLDEQHGQVHCTPQGTKLHGTPVTGEGTGSGDPSFCGTLETSKEQKTDGDSLLTTCNADSASENDHSNNPKILTQEKENNSEETGQEHVFDESSGTEKQNYSISERESESKAHEKESLCTEDDMLDMLENDL